MVRREFDVDASSVADDAAASDGGESPLHGPPSSPLVTLDRLTVAPALSRPIVRRIHRGSPDASLSQSSHHSDDASHSVDDEHDASESTWWSDARSEQAANLKNFDAHELRPVDALSVAAQELEYQLRGIGGTVRQFDEQVAQQRMAQAREEEQQMHHAEGVEEESIEARTRRAALYVRGALDGRHIVHGTGRLFEWAFFFQTHPYVRLIPMLCNTAHVLFVFWEPPNPAASLDFDLYPAVRQRVMVGIELAFCLVYALFLATRIRYLGWRYFLHRWYNIVYLGSALLMAIDACITLAYGPGLLRFSRAIRPLLVIANSARLRSLAVAMVNTIPAVVDVFGIMMLLIVIYATVAIQLFGGLYVDANSGRLLNDNFDSFPSAFIALVVLTSSENYPSVMYPALRSSSWSAVFFVTFILLETFLLMSVLIAVSFNRFLEQNRRQVLARRALQRRGLLAAFAALDHSNTSDIAFDDILRLLRELRGSDVDRDEARAVFAALDQDKSGSVDILEFFRITDVLVLGFYRLPHRHAHRSAETCFGRFRARLLAVVQSRWFNVLSAALILLSFVDICLSVAYIDDARLVSIFDIIDGVITGCFLIEVVMRMTALGVRAFFRDGWLIFDLLVVIVSLVFPIANALDEFVGVGSQSLVLRVFRLGRLIKAMRLIGVSMHFRVITMTYVYLWPMMWRLFALLSAVMVAYGIVGMELFGGTDMHLYSDGYVTFDTPFAALLSVFQLFTTSNWHQIMYAAMDATTAWASIYFLSFYFLVIKFILYLLLALIIESFSMAMESFDASRALAHAKQASVAAAAAHAASAAATRSPGGSAQEREWVAKRKRRFSISEMFDTQEHEGATFDSKLAADAGIETERMERFLERAATQQTVPQPGNVPKQ
jgi:hypothetical protein